MSEMRNAAKSERRWNASVIMARLLARRPPERKKCCTFWRLFPSFLVAQKGHRSKVFLAFRDLNFALELLCSFTSNNNYFYREVGTGKQEKKSSAQVSFPYYLSHLRTPPS